MSVDRYHLGRTTVFLTNMPWHIYFIKKKTVYRHFLIQAKHGLTYTCTQRTKNKEKKLKKGQQTNGLQAYEMTTMEQKSNLIQPADQIQMTKYM